MLQQVRATECLRAENKTGVKTNKAKQTLMLLSTVFKSKTALSKECFFIKF